MTTLAVTFALPAESSEFLGRLRNKCRVDRNGVGIIHGEIDNREIDVLHTGVGQKICRQRIGKFLQDQRFDFLISAGFAGALSDELNIGDLLLAKNFSTIGLDAVVVSVSPLPIHTANLVTLPALIDSSEERRKIARTSGAAAVDMETEFIARACAEHNIPLLSLRVITDSPAESFPAPPKILFDTDRQRTPALNFAGFFLAHPSRVPRLVQFARKIAQARKALANALVQVVLNL